jgi:hypothetical protein
MPQRRFVHAQRKGGLTLAAIQPPGKPDSRTPGPSLAPSWNVRTDFDLKGMVASLASNTGPYPRRSRSQSGQLPAWLELAIQTSCYMD